MKEFISKKIFVYNPETGKHEPIDAIRGESAYEIAVRTGQTTLPEDEWIKQVQNGQIDSDFVKTVNSLHPDENGNVKVTVNGQTADENGNIAVDVGGKVKSVNGQFPDPETGNVEIEVGNPDVITTLTRDEFNTLTATQIQKMYEDGVRTILVENEMEEGEETYTISWDGITDKPNAFPPSQHTHGLYDEVDAAKLGGKAPDQYLLADATAVNSEKLDSHTPEYYLPAVNLLENSDFVNLINRMGAVSGTLSMSSTLFVDRWMTYQGYANNMSYAFLDSGLQLSSVASVGGGYGITQQLSGALENGKTYTLAAMIDGKVYAGSFVKQDFAGNITIGSYTNIILVFMPAYYNRESIDIRFSDVGGSHVIKWAALYEGAYTADDVPPFVENHPRVESLRLGYPVHPRNLLDNSDFSNPVNQRGQTDYTFDSGFTIDRWRLHWTGLDGKLTVKKNRCIELYRPTYNAYLFQHPENPETMVGKTYTVAAKCRYNGAIGWIDSTQRIGTPEVHWDDWGILTYTFTVGSATPDEGGVYGVEIKSSSNLSFEIAWVALYEGSYTAETLPPYIPKGYNTEFFECQRYYIPFNTGDVIGLAMTYADGTGGTAFVNTRVAMRVDPDITQTAGYIRTGGQNIAVTVSECQIRGNGIRVDFTMNNGVQFESGAFYINGNGAFACEL